MVWVCCYDTPSDVLWAADGFMGMVRRAGMDFRSFDFFPVESISSSISLMRHYDSVPPGEDFVVLGEPVPSLCMSPSMFDSDPQMPSRGAPDDCNYTLFPGHHPAVITRLMPGWHELTRSIVLSSPRKPSDAVVSAESSYQHDPASAAPGRPAPAWPSRNLPSMWPTVRSSDETIVRASRTMMKSDQVRRCTCSRFAARGSD
jgi:hypothetical protein